MGFFPRKVDQDSLMRRFGKHSAWEKHHRMCKICPRQVSFVTKTRQPQYWSGIRRFKDRGTAMGSGSVKTESDQFVERLRSIVDLVEPEKIKNGELCGLKKGQKKLIGTLVKNGTGPFLGLDERQKRGICEPGLAGYM